MSTFLTDTNTQRALDHRFEREFVRDFVDTNALIAPEKLVTTTFGWAPLPGFVVVQTETKAEKTSGGIYMPKTAEADQAEAVVVAVGPPRQLSSGATRNRVVGVKDRVLIDPNGTGRDVTVDGNAYRVLPEDEILLVRR